MPHHPTITPEAETDPEHHSRHGIGLREESTRTPLVEDAVRRLRRRGVRVHVSHRNASQYRSHLGHAIDIPTVHVALQLPPQIPRGFGLPRFRTALGDSACYSPPANVCHKTHGPDILWRNLLLKAPDVDWKPSRPWIEVRLTITEPGSWLDALVALLDDATTPNDAQPDLFA